MSVDGVGRRIPDMRLLDRHELRWVGCGLLSWLVFLGNAQPASTGTTNATRLVPAFATNGATINRVRPGIPGRVVFNGVVSELNLSNRWFEVRGTNGVKRFSFRTNSNVLLTGNPIPISELRPGDRVGVVARDQTNDLPVILGVRVAARPPGEGNVKRTNPAPTD